jgi:hypothetical protein
MEARRRAENGEGKGCDRARATRLAARGGEAGERARRDGDADPQLQQGDDDPGRGEHGRPPYRFRAQRISQSSDRYFQLTK